MHRPIAASARTTSRIATAKRVSALLRQVGPSIKTAVGSTNPNVYENTAVVARAAGFDLHALSYKPGIRSSATALVASLGRLSRDADQAGGPNSDLGTVWQTIEYDYATVMKDSAILIGKVRRQTN